MVEKDRKLSYRVTSFDQLLSKEKISDAGSSPKNACIWFQAMLEFCRRLKVDVWYCPPGKKPGYLWFSSSDDSYRNEAFCGISVIGTKSGKACISTFGSAAERWLKRFSGHEAVFYRGKVRTKEPGGCNRLATYLDSFWIPEFSSPEELFFKMNVSNIGFSDETKKNNRDV